MNTSDTPRSHRARSRKGRRTALALAIPLGVVASGALVYQASYAAFTASTENEGNSWSTGSVVLSDSAGGPDSGTALFSEIPPLGPKSEGERCITVSYGGDLAADVVMSATASGTLAPHMNVTIEHGTDAPVECDDFESTATLYSGPLSGAEAGLAAATPPANSWAVSAAASRTYRIAYAVQGSATQSQAATAEFTWTAEAS